MTGSNQSVSDYLSSRSTSKQRAATLTNHPHVDMHSQIELSSLALLDKTGNADKHPDFHTLQQKSFPREPIASLISN